MNRDNDTLDLIFEFQGLDNLDSLEYLDIDCIQGVPLSCYLYCNNNDNGEIYDTRFLMSELEEIYEGEYFEFRKEFNAYMEYYEVYDN